MDATQMLRFLMVEIRRENPDVLLTDARNQALNMLDSDERLEIIRLDQAKKRATKNGETW